MYRLFFIAVHWMKNSSLIAINVWLKVLLIHYRFQSIFLINYLQIILVYHLDCLCMSTLWKVGEAFQSDSILWLTVSVKRNGLSYMRTLEKKSVQFVGHTPDSLVERLKSYNKLWCLWFYSFYGACSHSW